MESTTDAQPAGTSAGDRACPMQTAAPDSGAAVLTSWRVRTYSYCSLFFFPTMGDLGREDEDELAELEGRGAVPAE